MRNILWTFVLVRRSTHRRAGA